MRVLLAAVLCALPATAGLLSPVGIFVNDSSGSPRASFSNNERVTLSARLSNSVASANRVQFTFRIQGPSGAEVFRHTGNSVPGSVGNSASQVSGVPISQFFTGPGVYTFGADAVLDGQTVTQSAQFTVSSPNIIMVYPPNGARDVSDKPLSFRWVSSGAAKYRVTVGDNAALYNSVFSQETLGGENFLSYPEAPADPRANLSSGQVYYWKVDGLDTNGNVVVKADVPFNFTARTASLTRDLAVASLESTGLVSAEVFFRVTVSNQGGTSEANVPLRLSLGGLPAAGSPMTLPLMSPGDAREYTFSAPIPMDQAQSLAIACVEFFDDNVPNNCKTLQVTRPTTGSGSGFGPQRPLTKEELWQALLLKLTELGYDLGGYEIESMSQLSTEDMAALLAELSRGQVQVGVSGPPTNDAPPISWLPPDLTGGGDSWDGAFSAPPDLPAPSEGAGAAEMAYGSEAGPGDAVKSGEFWSAIEEQLRKQGIDLREYDIADMGEHLSIEDQQAFFDQLTNGEVDFKVTGPPPGPPPGTGFGGGGATDPGPHEELPQFAEQVTFEDVGTEPASATPAVRASARGFSGQTVENFGAKGFKSVLRDQKSFAKLWKRMSSSQAPEIDFSVDMVVVVVAGTKKPVERIEFERVAEGPDGLKVVTRTSGKSEKKGTAPYALVVIRASGLQAEFRDAAEER